MSKLMCDDNDDDKDDDDDDDDNEYFTQANYQNISLKN